MDALTVFHCQNRYMRNLSRSFQVRLLGKCETTVFTSQRVKWRKQALSCTVNGITVTK